MNSTRKALKISFISQYIMLVVQFAATVIIARLLTPTEIGIFSVGMALLGIGHLLRDFGSGQYIVQEQDLTQDRIRAAFTVTLALGWSIAAVIYLIAPYAANYYQQPGIEKILSLLALNFCLIPFGSITMAYCSRNMDFRPKAIANISSTSMQAMVSILLAYLGFSYMSLAWASLAATATTILVVILFRPDGLPLLPGYREIGRVLSFGSKMSFITILNEIATITPQLVLGKSQGFHSVGLFSRAQGTVSLFQQLLMRGLTPVIAPVFSKSKREGANIHDVFIFGTTCITGVAWLFFVNLGVLASPFILTLYGENWLGAAPLVQIWCIAAIINQLTSLVESSFSSIGEVDSLLKFSMILHPARILLLAGAAAISLETVLIVMIILSIFRFMLLWRPLSNVLNIEISDYLHIVFLSGFPALASGIAAISSKHMLESSFAGQPFVILVTSGILSLAVWAIAAFMVKHPLRDELLSHLNKHWQKGRMHHKNST